MELFITAAVVMVLGAVLHVIFFREHRHRTVIRIARLVMIELTVWLGGATIVIGHGVWHEATLKPALVGRALAAGVVAETSGLLLMALAYAWDEGRISRFARKLLEAKRCG